MQFLLLIQSLLQLQNLQKEWEPLRTKGEFKMEDIDTQQNARGETKGGGSLDQLGCFHRGVKPG